MNELTKKKCRPCEGGVLPLSVERIDALLPQIPGWRFEDGALKRNFSFKNFYETMAFANVIAWVAHQEDHHPDMTIGYNTLVVCYMTHAIGGLSENDFICAAKINALVD
jgi:4a-hydroxytetrahydrobiopterin dehydratase